jgi:hypothetical protein
MPLEVGQIVCLVDVVIDDHGPSARQSPREGEMGARVVVGPAEEEGVYPQGAEK